MNKHITRLLIIAVLFIGGVLLSVPSSIFGDGAFQKALDKYAVTLGLDLAGGTELDYKIDMSDAQRANNDDDPTNDLSIIEIDQLAESVRDALEQRVNPAGVAETVVKRSQMNGEEHILIQLPPSTNVAQVKADAERDNTLEFYEEDPELEAATRGFIGAELSTTTAQNWDEKVQKLTVDQNARGIVHLFAEEERSADTFNQQEEGLLSVLEATPEGAVAPEIVTTMVFEQVPLSSSSLSIELPEEVRNNTNLTITQPVGQFSGMVYLKEKNSTENELETPKTVEARHILFAYPESGNDNTPYKTRAEALAKAEETLSMLQEKNAGTQTGNSTTSFTVTADEDGTVTAGDTEELTLDLGSATTGNEVFAEAAKELSNGPTGVNGGELGVINKGQMVPEFDAAVFGAEDIGLVSDIIETQFGFHIIDIQAINEPTTTTETVNTYTYEMIGWDENELRWSPTPLGGKQLEKAVPDFNEANQPQVVLLFDTEGKDMFSELTKRMAARTCRTTEELRSLGYDEEALQNLDPRVTACRLGIRVGGDWVSTPTVTEHIPSRQVLISGNFTLDEAKALANGLNLGAIDAPVSLSGELSIQPELGAEQLQKSLKAAAIGFIVILLYMLFSYRMAGVVAVVALILYALLFISILKLSGTSIGQEFGGPVVLSLAGVAGMVLSIGLAVDGNILIFERMREELNHGKNLFEAVELGFKRAKAAIWDSNLTTLLVCIILFIFGKSVVRGFAITLIIGTLLSLFTSLWVSSGLLKWLISLKPFQGKSLYISSKTQK